MTSKSEYRNSWIAEKLDRINLTVPKGQKDVIKAHAEAQGKSVNGFINDVIEESMNQGDFDIFSAQIRCPYRDCGHVWVEDLEDFVQGSMAYERQMGDEIEHTIEADLECPQCCRELEATGAIWEYPVGAQNYVDVLTSAKE